MKIERDKYILLSIFIILFYLPVSGNSQNVAVKDTSRRLGITIITASTFYAGTLGYFYYLWYRDSPTSGFQWINDNSDWLQVDKTGHATTVYTFSEYSYHSLRWSGIDNNKAALYGALAGVASMATVELFDGFHSKWGASWGDLVANTSGALLFYTQQTAWQEQRFRLKFSYLPSDKYAPFNPDILGKNQLNKVVSDYNSQTYWLSANISSFITKPSKFPKWLNFAFGYGGRGLAVRPQYDMNGNVLTDYIRTREYYLSFDIDLERIPTHSKTLKTLFKLANFVKIPFPTVRYDKVNKYSWYWIYF